MRQKDTLPQVRATKTQLQSDRDHLQRIWAGIRTTLDTIQRGNAAVTESIELLGKPSRDQQTILIDRFAYQSFQKFLNRPDANSV